MKDIGLLYNVFSDKFINLQHILLMITITATVWNCIAISISISVVFGFVFSLYKFFFIYTTIYLEITFVNSFFANVINLPFDYLTYS